MRRARFNWLILLNFVQDWQRTAGQSGVQSAVIAGYLTRPNALLTETADAARVIKELR